MRRTGESRRSRCPPDPQKAPGEIEIRKGQTAVKSAVQDFLLAFSRAGSALKKGLGYKISVALSPREPTETMPTCRRVTRPAGPIAGGEWCSDKVPVYQKSDVAPA
jgi:hypothetical protein